MVWFVVVCFFPFSFLEFVFRVNSLVGFFVVWFCFWEFFGCCFIFKSHASGLSFVLGLLCLPDIESVCRLLPLTFSLWQYS